MARVSVQVGPRTVGWTCASWGRAIARDRSVAILLAVAIAFNVVLVAMMLMLSSTAAPAVYVPAAFCPSGQHVIAAGCAPNR